MVMCLLLLLKVSKGAKIIEFVYEFVTFPLVSPVRCGT